MPLRRTLANDNGILSGLMFTTVRRGRLAVCGGIDGGIDRVANDEIETVLEADWRGTPLDGSSGTSPFEIGSKPCSATGDHQADDIDSARWSPSWALLGCCRLSPRRHIVGDARHGDDRRSSAHHCPFRSDRVRRLIGSTNAARWSKSPVNPCGVMTQCSPVKRSARWLRYHHARHQNHSSSTSSAQDWPHPTRCGHPCLMGP